MQWSRPALVAHVDRSGGGRARILAPAVGRWVDLPRTATLVGPGMSLGRLVTLTRSRELLMPDGVAGTIEEVADARELSVAFHDLLFRVRELSAGDRANEGGARGIDHAAADLPRGAIAVTAPTDGVFYCRPAADAAPFVEPGSIVRSGQAVGLVEVMKTFNQIVYGGPHLPRRARVAEVRCADGDEIHAGQILVVVEPLQSG